MIQSLHVDAIRRAKISTPRKQRIYIARDGGIVDIIPSSARANVE
jgi:hypothetical protein